MATKQTTKKKKKTWFSIVTPKEFGSETIGETLAVEGKQLINRKVKINLMKLMNDIKKQNVQLTFRIKEVTEKMAITEIISYNLLSSYMKRIMRKGRDKIEDSFTCETKDGTKIRIKPIIITRNKVQNSVLSELKKTARKHLTETIKTKDYFSLINSLVSTKLQVELKENLKKIYPVAILEFKSVTKEK